MILTHTLLVLLSISNVQTAVLCLPRFWAPGSVVLCTGPSHTSPSTVVMHDCFACPLSSNQWCEGTVIWGRFLRGCEGTVTRSRLLDKGGAGGMKEVK